MFQFPGFPPSGLCVQPAVTAVRAAGFPHSDITGSPPAHGSPVLFAVCHVLPRLLTPRHPPFAFSRLSRHTETAFQRRFLVLDALDVYLFVKVRVRPPVVDDWQFLRRLRATETAYVRCACERSPTYSGPDSTRTSDLSLIRGVL
jgi:hypothetical protein